MKHYFIRIRCVTGEHEYYTDTIARARDIHKYMDRYMKNFMGRGNKDESGTWWYDNDAYAATISICQEISKEHYAVLQQYI